MCSRHFALNRYFRKNHLFSVCDLLTRMRPEEFVAKNEKEQNIERWRIQDVIDDNPLMLGGWLLTSLAVESYLGNIYATKILRKALIRLATLYKFKGNNFDGYILRWDPVCREDWECRVITDGTLQPGMEQIKYSNNFLVGQDNNYLYCAPSTDPRYVRFKPQTDPEYGAWLEFFDKFRRMEPSMDEIVGLVSGYSMISTDQIIQSMVREQVPKLADYLNAHGYILLRPCGGFSARGASGASPVFEFPINRAFSRITGRIFSASIGFEDVMRKAKMWQCIEGPTNWCTIGGFALSPAVTLLQGVLVLIGIFAGEPFITASSISSVQLGRVYGLRGRSKITFDIST
ncbi:MAG: hypothetical protein WBX01_10730 [Nitrososphaeraceae archaeon]